ncbi:hypothetical protein OHD16_10605 [Sphingobacterium sp. ML3W]|uniref:hypothetical protein n=1 Tax=Sphingobacterium sp. ML3W TaxID=1538644 RepID=UPI00249C1718|nr:hypothetical protein [Sphingobacterium sp. ML3W]WFA80411.1 hypothetical protein OGI71_03750 [Sphingobacterium sp. ML3W]
MKRTFNTAGVFDLQEEVLTTIFDDRLAIINFVMSDFVGFILAYFDLSPSQIQYLNNMSTALKTALSIGIADSWINNLAVDFQKESSMADEEEDTPKDIILSRYNSSSTPPVASSLLPTGYFSIRIVYRNSAYR